MASVYRMHRNINQPICFKGLKAQYISLVAVCLVGLLIVFAILYIIGLNPFICVAVAVLGGAFAIRSSYRMSSRYGAHGLMKKMASRRIPKLLKTSSRKIFY